MDLETYAQKTVREALELAEPLAPAPTGANKARRMTLAVVCGLLVALVGSTFRVSFFQPPQMREPDWPMVFKGFSDTLSSAELEKLENDALRDMPTLVHNAIEFPMPDCMAQVDACLDNRSMSVDEADMDSFFARLDACLARAAQCAFEAEEAEAERALATANADLLSAVQMLEQGGAAGAKKLAGALRGASVAVAKEFPSVAAFLRDVAERVLAFLAKHLPLWVAAAKEIGGDFAVQLLAALKVLKEHLPGFANQCKCGLGEGAKALKDASATAVQLLHAELPKWTDEAKKVGMGAIIFAEGFLNDLPKVVDMCKTELEKQIAKDGKKAVIQKALVVGAAVGAVGFWMHQHHKETQALREAAEGAESVERRSLRAKASESQKRGWPDEEMLARMYHHGLWEDFGRQAGRMLKNGFENKTVEENRFLDIFPQWED